MESVMTEFKIPDTHELVAKGYPPEQVEWILKMREDVAKLQGKPEEWAREVRKARKVLKAFERTNQALMKWPMNN